GFAQLARKGLDSPDLVIRDIGKIEAASLHAREVVRKLMLFARQSPQRKVFTNLNEIIEDGLYFLESRCAKAGIKLVKKLGTDMPEIEVDKSQLYQVLVNLLVNAIQAMPKGGTITIRTEGHEAGVTFSVADNGTGIKKDILEKIFVPFFTTKDVNEGTGLGLAVVHGIVTSHGGTVNVKSKPGKGTEFVINLPIKVSEDIISDGEDNHEHE
ncbi:MAG: GHKL domain-containing protein, partial [Candidatus Zixiibacteriota bacterium]